MIAKTSNPHTRQRYSLSQMERVTVKSDANLPISPALSLRERENASVLNKGFAPQPSLHAWIMAIINVYACVYPITFTLNQNLSNMERQQYPAPISEVNHVH